MKITYNIARSYDFIYTRGLSFSPTFSTYMKISVFIAHLKLKFIIYLNNIKTQNRPEIS